MRTRALYVAAGWILLLAAVSTVSGTETDRDRYRILYETKSPPSTAGRGILSCPRPIVITGEEGAAGFDILHYRIDISIDPGTEFVSGAVTVHFRVAAPALDSIYFHLNDNMNVQAVLGEELPLGFIHEQNKIRIALNGAYATDETLSVEISYDGHPVPQGLRFYGEATYNLSEPDLARNWFPCYDEPWDKATSEMIATVPDTLFCASNGLLIDEWDNPDDTKTYHWKTNYRLSTYLISVAVSNYVSFSHWYRYSPTDSMEMPYYVYPRKYDIAQVSFSHAPDMMEFFSQTFGRYPFISEKYGTALAPLNGAMENFTCTTYGAGFTYTDFTYDWVVAHEMAHSWFGNSVTLDDWRDIWLNEGFATYGDALWHEHFHGESSYEDRMAQFRQDYFTEDETVGRFPVYDPAAMWGATVYKKGAWVLHMLRYLMGDAIFFNVLQTYHSTFAYGSASTEDFRAVAESVSKMDLSAFFSQWVYQAGYPEYEYSWSSLESGPDFILNFDLAQVQTDAPVFTIPVEILVTTTSGDSLLQLPVQEAAGSYHFVFTEEPVALEFDPGEGILKKAAEVATSISAASVPRLLTARISPNPSNRSARIEFFLPRAGDVHLAIYDVTGRLIERISKRNLAAAWNSIDLTGASDGEGARGTGVYFYRVTAGGESVTGKFVVIR